MDTFKKWTGGYENVGETHQVRRRDRAMRRDATRRRRAREKTYECILVAFRQHPLEMKCRHVFLVAVDDS